MDKPCRQIIACDGDKKFSLIPNEDIHLVFEFHYVIDNMYYENKMLSGNILECEGLKVRLSYFDIKGREIKDTYTWDVEIAIYPGNGDGINRDPKVGLGNFKKIK